MRGTHCAVSGSNYSSARADFFPLLRRTLPTHTYLFRGRSPLSCSVVASRSFSPASPVRAQRTWESARPRSSRRLSQNVRRTPHHCYYSLDPI